MREIYNKVITRYGNDILTGSMLEHEAITKPIIKILQPQNILEIGTHLGLSAILWANLSDMVTTIDIRMYQQNVNRWQDFNVNHKINFIRVASNEQKKRIVSGLDFDFAFIDGGHTKEDVQFDFEITKKCGKVLFHDYKPEGGIYAKCTNERMQDLVEFVDGLSPQIFIFGPLCSQFALWVDENKIEKSRIEDIKSCIDIIQKSLSHYYQ